MFHESLSEFRKRIMLLFDNPIGALKTIQKLFENYIAGRFSTSEFTGILKIKLTELEKFVEKVREGVEAVRTTSEDLGIDLTMCFSDCRFFLKIYERIFPEIIKNPSRDNVAKTYNGSFFKQGLKGVLEHTIRSLTGLRESEIRTFEHFAAEEAREEYMRRIPNPAEGYFR